MTQTCSIASDIQDILTGRQILCENTHYELHEAISELTPEDALKSIAQSALHFQNIHPLVVSLLCF